MAFEPTAAQQAAIDARGNILVSAAAGSGKTAVLVERVIKMLTDESNPVNADRLLIVTFTNAAAAEMRTRIEKRLDAECRANPDNIGLLRQRQQLNNAKICTIDSFCIDLVRENFEKVVEKFRKNGLEVNVDIMGERPCGRKNSDDPAQKELSFKCRDIIAAHHTRIPGFTSASTDCNIPFSLGIPAATIGLCLGGKAHTRQEWIYTESLKTGFAIAADLISEQFA